MLRLMKLRGLGALGGHDRFTSQRASRRNGSSLARIKSGCSKPMTRSKSAATTACSHAFASRSSGNDLDIREMRVRFLNGEEQVIRIDQMIREGRATPDFDLAGRRRGIQSIFLRYNGRPLFGGKSRVRVMALKDGLRSAAASAASRGLAVRRSSTRRSVNAASDRIEFDVGRNDGMITQIRLRAVDGPLLYRAVEITFGNGQTQMIDGIERLQPGEQGKAIDLEGDRRFIKKVVVFKRPSWRPGDSRVELLGLVQPRPAASAAAAPACRRSLADGSMLSISQTVDKAADTDHFPRRPPVMAGCRRSSSARSTSR